MGCERWREMLSAQLDGEDNPDDRPLVDKHLAGCAACRGWLEAAAAVNRRTRTGVGIAPDLSVSILAALSTAGPEGDRQAQEVGAGVDRQVAGAGPDRQARLVGAVTSVAAARPRWRRIPSAGALYVALAVVGAVQLILGLGQVGGGVAAAHVHAGLNATPGHLWHESAAWNVAVGAGYLFLALRRSRPSGLVPMLTAFVGMLLLLSVNDLTGARVDGTRLASHGFVTVGYLLVVLLSKIPGSFAEPPGARSDGSSGWQAQFADDEPELAAQPPARLRLVPRGPMTAEHPDRRAA